MAMKIAKVI